MNKEQFIEHIQPGYQFKSAALELGAGMFEGAVVPEVRVSLPLKMMNRHGLIAGATGTGKTKSLQVLAEQLSEQGVSCMLLDIKGDLSGIAMPGTSNAKIEERHQLLGLPWKANDHFVELLTISNQEGTRLRATVSEFGPVLFSKILGLNDTQEGVLSMIFKFCDDNGLLLLDLNDLKKVIQFISEDGKDAIEKEFGSFSSVSSGTILRKVIELEQQGADVFFGERSFEVEDLIRTDAKGRGVISILRATDIQDKPKFFSTFMLQMLAELYSKFPEVGDLEKPKLMFFLDEAHLLFEEATPALLNQLETVIKLIRSKGIGLIFITQNPIDIPETVLAQLGLKIQHALRAFTAKDRKAIKMAAENYPETECYEVSQKITELGIGEAFVTGLNEKGIPTPLVQVMMRAPESRMDILTDAEITQLVSRSEIARYYNEEINRESAEEILQKKYEERDAMNEEQETDGPPVRKGKSTLEKVFDSTVTRQVGRTVARELTRGLLGMFGIKTTTTRRRKTSWF
ncbi:MAG TPA: helicase HerA-like domain-containing protein [Saprospiraceae bacterium]|nr:helicase HerA-like domain-containing protein [Saprospiraceae bacterium]